MTKKQTKAMKKNYKYYKGSCNHFMNIIKNSNLDLSDKTSFVVGLSDFLVGFVRDHQLDPEIQKIQHMSTSELIKKIKETENN